MKQSFSLLTDPWIPAVVSGRPKILSLESTLTKTVDDITAPAPSRLAIIRLLLAMKSYDNFPSEGFQLYGGFLQCEGLPRKSARTPHQIINMIDAGNMALDPTASSKVPTDAEVAIALVTAFSCDRPGLKARVPGVSVSGQCPLHMGKLIAMPGATITEILDFFLPPDSDWCPWWERPVSYDDEWSGHQAQYLMWPWRRVQIYSPTEIVIAPGQVFNPKWMIDEKDPWCIKKATLGDRFKPIDLGDWPSGSYDVTAIALNQASPVDCWNKTVAWEKKADPEEEEKAIAAYDAALSEVDQELATVNWEQYQEEKAL